MRITKGLNRYNVTFHKYLNSNLRKAKVAFSISEISLALKKLTVSLFKGKSPVNSN